MLVTDGFLEHHEQMKKIFKKLESFLERSIFRTCAASSRLQPPPTAIHHIWEIYLIFSLYMLQNLRALNEADKQTLLKYDEHCSTQPESYSEYLSQFLSNKCMARIYGVGSKQLVTICVFECPDEDSPVALNNAYVMKWSALSKDLVICHHFFENENVRVESYRYMLIHYAFLLSGLLQEDYIFSSTVVLHGIQTELQLT